MTRAKKKLLAISGSTRRNSVNQKILETIAHHYKEYIQVEIFNQLDRLPHFNPDLVDRAPSQVQNFFDLVRNSDGVMICSPEYVFSLPGSLKNALEWTVATTLFSYKPVGIVVASASGEKALESLDLIMSTLVQTKIPNDCKLLIQGGRGKINSQGEIDTVVMEEVFKVVDALNALMQNQAVQQP